jgi:hypothetical protein
MEIRNAKFNRIGTIDLEWNHPEFGWIEFTANPDDVEEHGRQLHSLAMQGEVAPYVSPPIEEQRESMKLLTARQLRLGLVNNGFTLTQVTDAIDAIPDETDRAKAKIEWEYAATFDRIHPLVITIGTALGLSEDQIDTIWVSATQL